MKDLMNRRKIKKQWKGFLKKEEFFDYNSMYRTIHNTAQSMMLQMVDFLFIEDIYNAFIELLELNNNIDIMLAEKSPESIALCKERIDFLLQNKMENWYI